MNSAKLQAHVFGSYWSMRYGLAALAFVYPPFMYLVGRFIYGIEVVPSISQYYFLDASASAPTYPMRTWFVGFSFAINVALYLYKGFSKKENVALNLAAFAGIVVAVLPFDPNCKESAFCCALNWHTFFGVVDFLGLFYVMLFRSGDTLCLLKDKQAQIEFARFYRTLAWVVLLAPLLALGLTVISQGRTRWTFFFESLGIECFALYWWKKSEELSLSNADRRALAGNLTL